MTLLVHSPQLILLGDKDKLIPRLQQYNSLDSDVLWHGGTNYAQKTALLPHPLDRVLLPTLKETTKSHSESVPSIDW